MEKVLDRVNVPADLKALSEHELRKLCKEIREQLMIRLSVTGGHVGSNLAMIEATVALHTVFDAPRDKIIFDVSHQCYTHKMLTGRKEAYTVLEKYGSVSGFTNPAESEYDIFSVGHTSTAISLATGIAKARDLKREAYQVIAVVGDGALGGGEALEGLNNAAELGSGLIVMVNDNCMSIAENHGGLYGNLRLLRETGGTAQCNLFRAIGLDYRFVRDGNDVCEIADTLRQLKEVDHPVIVHLCTRKGKGYGPAELDREGWHYREPFDVHTGKLLHPPKPVETYENLTRDYLARKMKRDPLVVAVTAGTPKIFGFDEALRKQFQGQFVDVGIAEEHAVAMVSGIAKNGGKPVFGVSSTFLQRTYDQLLSDLALNNSPAVILVFFAGISGGSQTHMGIFDMSMASGIPGIICLSPTCREEYLHMLEWGLEQTDHPVVIRVPGIETVSRKAALLDTYDASVRYEIVEQGTEVAILALGNFFELGRRVWKSLKETYGISGTLVNPRCVSFLDERTLYALQKCGHRLVVTLEDGVLDGGFGERVAAFYGSSSMRVLSFGVKKEFVNHVPVREQYKRYHLTVEQIVHDIMNEN